MEATHETTSCSHCHQPLYMDRSRLAAAQWQCPACGAANAGKNVARSADYVSPSRQAMDSLTERRVSIA